MRGRQVGELGTAFGVAPGGYLVAAAHVASGLVEGAVLFATQVLGFELPLSMCALAISASVCPRIFTASIREVSGTSGDPVCQWSTTWISPK